MGGWVFMCPLSSDIISLDRRHLSECFGAPGDRGELGAHVALQAHRGHQGHQYAGLRVLNAFAITV